MNFNYKSTETPDAVTLEPTLPADATVIWLHGLGADGNDFVPIVPELRLPNSLRIRFVFPHAPVRPVTINNGYRMRAWYDIVGAAIGDREDKVGIADSEHRVRTYIQRELEAGIDSKRIVIAGFSQGGAIALQTALRYPQPLAGVMALSTYLPMRDSLRTEAAADNRGISILMCHGTHDAIVPVQLGELSRAVLDELGYRVQWKTYPMEHSVIPDEIDDISKWLTSRITPL